LCGRIKSNINFNAEMGDMITNEHTFQNNEGISLFYHEWLPDGDDIRGLPTNDDIRAIVFVVHGHGEHSGRYTHVAQSFTEAGFACYGIDHRGHGKSAGDRAYIPDMELAVADLRLLYDKITPQYPDKPVLIFGHSMGTLISLLFTLRYQSDVTALVLTGVAITGEESQPALLVSSLMFVASLMPKLTLSPPSSATVLSTDPDIIGQWENDPLNWHGMWRLGTSKAMILAGRTLRERIQELTLPLLVMHGGADELTPSSGATLIEQQAKSADITVKIYDGLRHELVNEVGKEDIIQDITDWLVAHS